MALFWVILIMAPMASKRTNYYQCPVLDNHPLGVSFKGGLCAALEKHSQRGHSDSNLSIYPSNWQCFPLPSVIFSAPHQSFGL